MARTIRFLENRRTAMQGRLEMLVELDRILSAQGSAPYVLERHEQMTRLITEARDEIELLWEEQKIVEAEWRQLLGLGARGYTARLKKSRKI